MDKSVENTNSNDGVSETKKTNVNQEQVHDLLFNREIGWQEIIYDLINTEQLDPWDVDIVVLTNEYLKRIQQLEEMDFFISSKVLLAAALLLRIKSEILLNRYIKSIDEILFGKQDKKKESIERIELEESIPELIPRSPLPRFRKVTLKELIEALNKAIITENRRIKKEIVKRNTLRETSISLPKKRISIKDKIREIYEKLSEYFKINSTEKHIAFSSFVGADREEKIISFSSLLHLENQKKVWLEQENPFEEIYIWLKNVYLKHNPDPFSDLKSDIDEISSATSDKAFLRKKPAQEKQKGKQKTVLKTSSEDFENPLAGVFD